MNIFKNAFPAFLILLACYNLAAQDDLGVLKDRNGWLAYTDSHNTLYHHITDEAYDLLERRRRTVAEISTLAEWKSRQQWIKQTLNEVVGPFPGKTPLHARITKTVDKGDYRLENIVFESQPGFYVTSTLYIPGDLKRRAKAPAIIYCSGHAPEGYRSETYQHIILNLVKKGFVVFAFDPVGQGERLEYPDGNTGKSAVGGPTAEHSYPGSQAFIAGNSQAKYMIWDGIRAVDYLLTRKEVDPARIGITGRSGGGTQSSYIAAFDDRIKAAAPECYITSFSRLLQSIGPQDAEQNFFNGIAKGIDHGDLLIVRAPKPTLMITTTRDIFSIQGARETAAEVARIYNAYGNGSAFGMIEDDAPHASTKKNREGMYAFFQRHLNNPGDSTDEEVTLLTADEIRVTTTGQVATSLGGQTVFKLNRAEIQQSLDKKIEEVNATNIKTLIRQVKEMSGYRDPDSISSAVFTGRIQRDGYAIEKYFTAGEGEYVIPFLLMVPSQSIGKTILYLHPSGKSAEAGAGAEMESFVRKGYTVLAPDLPGIGELGPGDFHGDAFIGGTSHNIWYAAMLIGRSIVGIQAGDINRVLESMPSLASAPVYGVARKEMTSLLLHAAAFVPAIKKVALIEPLGSYQSFVSEQFYHSPFITGAVPGCLKRYDLPDLIACLLPRKVLLYNPLDGAGKAINREDASRIFSPATKTYDDNNARAQLTISGPGDDLWATLDKWMDGDR